MFTKDMKAIINLSSKVGVKQTMINAVEKTNKQQINNILEGINLTGNVRAEQLAVPVIFELCERFRQTQQSEN